MNTQIQNTKTNDNTTMPHKSTSVPRYEAPKTTSLQSNENPTKKTSKKSRKEEAAVQG
jgi:hypothetical protein